MIQIRQMKLPIRHTEEELRKKIAKNLRIPESQIKSYRIRKRSIDARKKSELCYVYTVDVEAAQERKIPKKVYSNNIMSTNEKPYALPSPGTKKLSHPPVIVGSGPAGLFCGLLLARAGYQPLIMERGRRVEERMGDVEQFWRTGVLNPESNVAFGEGGAGTFSDGKLNTLVKDEKGRNQFVLDAFCSFGAPEHIRYEAKPHIGTDILCHVVKQMREEFLRLGGKVLFETCVTGVEWEKGMLSAVTCQSKGQKSSIPAEVVVLATGHSARDSFYMLLEQGVQMEAKSFAVGLRVEHPQQMISEAQYGREGAGLLPPAPYKVTAKLGNQRGIYSFCMCPGGYVVNASTEPGCLAINGMSYSKRDGANANSAVIVTVTPQDFGGSGPLAGIEFQRRLETAAFAMGEGRIPQQLFGDFEAGRVSAGYGGYGSCAKGSTVFAPLHELFQAELTESLIQGMHQFAAYLPNFDRPDCILSGVESRTSSPVRIPRNEQFVGSKPGLYPCGEGAGYAGGIMSAAMDGMKVAEAIIRAYGPLG